MLKKNVMIGSRKRAKKPTGRDSQLNLHFGRQNKEHTLLALKEGPVFRVRSMPQRLQCKRVWKGKVEKNHYTFSYPLGKVKDVKKFGKIFNQAALSLSPLGIQSRESNSKKVFPSRKTTNRKSTPWLAPLGIRSRLKKHSYQRSVFFDCRGENELARQLVVVFKASPQKATLKSLVKYSISSALSLSPLGIQSRKRTNKKSALSLSPLGIESGTPNSVNYGRIGSRLFPWGVMGTDFGAP
ncbi:hypothetical protein NPIL_426821 [Nephila pilipes]|uniref:Uncharacterized protein n=1 Tax=Nephila pilipes TaxID=299642 RepID=A0A8X6UAB6_NEPPI|nr:hypothetical protein NPIL_426821 [Nephila pilipes]